MPRMYTTVVMSPKLQMTTISLDSEQSYQLKYKHLYHPLVLSYKKEHTMDTQKGLDGSQGHLLIEKSQSQVVTHYIIPLR